jgi:hypothetical protein
MMSNSFNGLPLSSRVYQLVQNDELTFKEYQVLLDILNTGFKHRLTFIPSMEDAINGLIRKGWLEQCGMGERVLPSNKAKQI